MDSTAMITVSFPAASALSVQHKRGWKHSHTQKIWTDADTEFLRVNYLNMTDEKIAQTLGVSRPTISTRALAMNLRTRRPESRLRKDFFKVWSSDMSYCLGLLTSDGDVRLRGFRFVCSTDREAIFLKIKEVLGSHHTIGHRPPSVQIIEGKECHTRGSSELFVCSTAMAKDLRLLGLEERKSLRETIPGVPEQFRRDFVRGFFDGDGSISWGWRNNRPGSQCVVQFYGGDGPLRALRELMGNVVKGYSITDTWHPLVRKLVFGRGDSLALYNWMYSTDSCLFLDCKKYKFEDYMRNGNGQQRP